jgi:hypothetical protein
VLPLPSAATTAHAAFGRIPAAVSFYRGVNGPLSASILGSSMAGGAPPQDRMSPAPDGERPLPKFYKLEFPTYDGSEDPLNWLSHCEQFFRGQRTLASDRTWLASYHLHGPAQTWYCTLEQSEGMPSWERFKELCHLQFGPPVRDSRLAELGRLPFRSTVQDFAERFNALLCHARNLDNLQKAELFVGASRTTSGSTWQCAHRKIYQRRCIWRGPLSCGPMPCWPWCPLPRLGQHARYSGHNSWSPRPFRRLTSAEQ